MHKFFLLDSTETSLLASPILGLTRIEKDEAIDINKAIVFINRRSSLAYPVLKFSLSFYVHKVSDVCFNSIFTAVFGSKTLKPSSSSLKIQPVTQLELVKAVKSESNLLVCA